MNAQKARKRVAQLRARYVDTCREEHIEVSQLVLQFSQTLASRGQVPQTMMPSKDEHAEYSQVRTSSETLPIAINCGEDDDSDSRRGGSTAGLDTAAHDSVRRAPLSASIYQLIKANMRQAGLPAALSISETGRILEHGSGTLAARNSRPSEFDRGNVTSRSTSIEQKMLMVTSKRLLNTKDVTMSRDSDKGGLELSSTSARTAGMPGRRCDYRIPSFSRNSIAECTLSITTRSANSARSILGSTFTLPSGRKRPPIVVSMTPELAGTSLASSTGRSGLNSEIPGKLSLLRPKTGAEVKCGVRRKRRREDQDQDGFRRYLSFPEAVELANDATPTNFGFESRNEQAAVKRPRNVRIDGRAGIGNKDNFFWGLDVCAVRLGSITKKTIETWTREVGRRGGRVSNHYVVGKTTHVVMDASISWETLDRHTEWLGHDSRPGIQGRIVRISKAEAGREEIGCHGSAPVVSSAWMIESLKQSISLAIDDFLSNRPVLQPTLSLSASSLYTTRMRYLHSRRRQWRKQEVSREFRQVALKLWRVVELRQTMAVATKLLSKAELWKGLDKRHLKCSHLRESRRREGDSRKWMVLHKTLPD